MVFVILFFCNINKLFIVVLVLGIIMVLGLFKLLLGWIYLILILDFVFKGLKLVKLEIFGNLMIVIVILVVCLL